MKTRHYTLKTFWAQWSSIPVFYNYNLYLIRYFAIFAFIFISFGLAGALYFAPTDTFQGEAFRILYVHVPSAILSLGIYTGMGFFSAVYLIFRVKMADIFANALAPIGTTFTLVTLLTGALWGKPMWGTWWVWDARLTSELMLFFIYAGYLGLKSAMPHTVVTSKILAVLCLCGTLNIPIIHFSVNWWYTLHQGPSLSKFSKPDIATEMLWPLLCMFLGFVFFTWAIALQYAKRELNQRRLLHLNVFR